MSKINTFSISEYQKNIFYILASTLFLIICLYAYLLNDVIQAAVFVEDNKEQMTKLGSTLSILENEYLSKDIEITLDKAYSMGFVDAATPDYLGRGPLSVDLSLNTVAQ
jgi:hypothetical protein